MSAKALVTALWAGLAVALLLPVVAFGHTTGELGQLEVGGEHTPFAALWRTWNLTPDIVAVTFVVAILYAAGVRRRRRGTGARHVAFTAGLAFVFGALASPLDTVAEHLFFVHQVQHLLLRMLGSMLIMLAAPHGVISAGLPAPVRKRLVAPLIGVSRVRYAFAFLTRPVTATILYVGSLYVWQLPRLHNASVLDPLLHYVMHITMLGAGLVFWRAIFDPRPAPRGPRYGVRLMMIWAQLFATIVLGAWLTLKEAVLYPAYDVTDRFDVVTPLLDEQLGGLVVWIPGGMMGVFAVLVVIARWGRHEARALRDAPPSPVGRMRDDAAVSGRIRGLALGLAAFALIVFATVILVGILSLASTREGSAF